MKKILFILFALTLCLFAVNLRQPKVAASASVEGELVSTTTEVYDDESYLVTEYYVLKESSKTRSNSYNITHTKTVTYYSASDKLLWTYRLYGTFAIVEGVSCVATSSSYEYTLESSAWHFSNGSSYCSGNQVFGLGTFKHKLLGITTKTMDVDIHIECDTYGNKVA